MLNGQVADVQSPLGDLLPRSIGVADPLRGLAVVRAGVVGLHRPHLHHVRGQAALPALLLQRDLAVVVPLPVAPSGDHLQHLVHGDDLPHGADLSPGGAHRAVRAAALAEGDGQVGELLRLDAGGAGERELGPLRQWLAGEGAGVADPQRVGDDCRRRKRTRVC